jgi:aspartate 1-decarboxylase
MMRTMLKSKIHRAHVTEVNIDYEGSIAIDKRLMAEADILPYEQVQVLNVNNGARFETYAIEAEPDSGVISIRGAAARLAVVGDIVIILAYCALEDEEARNFTPKVVYVDEKNAITKTKRMVGAIPFWEGRCESP